MVCQPDDFPFGALSSKRGKLFRRCMGVTDDWMIPNTCIVGKAQALKLSERIGLNI